ncbi:hypothetical protein ZIOFF_037804 [Zingiber officinale]|uniref:Proline iminopeptidase n=1 Tax=Zingiber officinale TaxID=94328 RepID=A0A8J5KZR5_ZINOF|nr:hypothetical protein ZIOFF_037804 [Zingiber officinale]
MARQRTTTRKKKQDQRRELEKDLKISQKVSNSHKEATESTPPQRHWGYSSIPDEITLTRSFKAWRNNLKGGYKILVCAEKSSTPVVQQYTFMGSSKEPQEYNSNLYPHIEPYSTGFLKVSDIHTLYWEQSGNPNGHPVVFLHGGPGAGTSASNRRFFDPEFYRIILLDQRGAGKSTPHACLVDNTTWDLIGDIEKLREHLGIPEWQVFGGSWGSTLALAYSQLHSDKVTGIILRGIFLLRKKELDWFYEGGAAAIFPDAWEPFRDFIPEEERDNFILAYNKRLNSDDLDVQFTNLKYSRVEIDEMQFEWAECMLDYI